MKKQDAYYWRLFATALSFSLFGLGGLLIGIVVFPLLQLSSSNADIRQHRARKINHLAFRLFIWSMKSLRVLTYEIKDNNNFRLKINQPSQLIIANHPTLIDVCFLISFVEQTNCIVRHGLFNNPFTRGPLKNAAYIPNIDAQQLINDCKNSLQQGQSLLIFPEGTRTAMAKKTPKLQRGAANIAIQAQVKPCPIKIKCHPHTLSKGKKWYNIAHQRPHWTFEMAEPIELPENSSPPLAARELNKAFQAVLFAD
ncbi:MAG: 1-acyl-sn-glycerol-3-phosphate acyltransferase [Pseudomonadales bacterium]|nr:1-acyl-sn-glycerol-3-phosphate acyltransferase [Pseudomonadales bacterium]